MKGWESYGGYHNFPNLKFFFREYPNLTHTFIMRWRTQLNQLFWFILKFDAVYGLINHNSYHMLTCKNATPFFLQKYKYKTYFFFAIPFRPWNLIDGSKK